MNAQEDLLRKALIVDDPWIDMILSGSKTWEMRSRPTRIRGRIGLIRKGSGLVVGTVRLVDSIAPLDGASYATHRAEHGIGDDVREKAVAGGWVHPWVLRDVRPFAVPVPYRHPRGAVIWVNLDEPTAGAVRGAA